jgi:hypothetical protein
MLYFTRDGFVHGGLTPYGVGPECTKLCRAQYKTGRSNSGSRYFGTEFAVDVEVISIFAAKKGK